MKILISIFIFILFITSNNSFSMSEEEAIQQMIIMSDNLRKQCDVNRDGLVDGYDWFYLSRSQKITYLSFALFTADLSKKKFKRKTTEQIMYNVTNIYIVFLDKYYRNKKNLKDNPAYAILMTFGG